MYMYMYIHIHMYTYTYTYTSRWIEDYSRAVLPKGGNMIIAEFRKINIASCMQRFAMATSQQ